MSASRETRFTASHTDRLIAGTRIALAAFSLFAIWLDPAEPARYTEVTYGLHTSYVGYSVVVAWLVWNRVGVTWLPLTTHVLDLAIFSVFQYLTMGPSSPFFVYFVFALFCAALRWGWRGTLRTIPVVVLAFVVMGASMSRHLGPTEFELNRFIIRIGYLIMVGTLLVYLGRHEDDRRRELRQLARWPAARDISAGTRTFVGYAADLLGADTMILLWSGADEPRVTRAVWSAQRWTVDAVPAADVDAPVADALAEHAFVAAGPFTGLSRVLTQRQRPVVEWIGQPFHPEIARELTGVSAGSAAFQTEHVSGRIIAAWPDAAGADVLPLLEAVARQMGTALGSRWR